MSPDQITIGIFDSGFGGLTVLRALLPLIPGAHFLYLGDTARLPYGSKSRETVARYAVSSARFLHDHGASRLVIACNTATALALEDIRHALPIPVLGVIEPGTRAAATPGAPGHGSETWVGAPHTPRQVLVLATPATVQSHAYAQSLQALGLEAYEKACPLLVPLIEEGWIDHPVTAEVLKIYLAEALHAAPDCDTLLLGCTHYPLLESAIRLTLASLNHPLTIIDSAQATAALVAQHYTAANTSNETSCTFFATDSVEKFERLGSTFLGQPVPNVHLIDLGA